MYHSTTHLLATLVQPYNSALWTPSQNVFHQKFSNLLCSRWGRQPSPEIKSSGGTYAPGFLNRHHASGLLGQADKAWPR